MAADDSRRYCTTNWGWNPGSKDNAKFQQYFWAILSLSDSVSELSVEWEVWIEEMFSWVSSFSHFSITYIGRDRRKKKKNPTTLQTVHYFLSELLSFLTMPTLTPPRVSRNAEGCNSYSLTQRTKAQFSFYSLSFAGHSSYRYPHKTCYLVQAITERKKTARRLECKEETHMHT